jgi:hypothetical protein
MLLCSCSSRGAGVVINAFGDPVVKLVGVFYSISGLLWACLIHAREIIVGGI